MLTIKNYNKIIYTIFFLTINLTFPIKNNFILMISLYNEQHQDRVREYIECLERNLAHPLIGKIHVVYDISKETANESNMLKFLNSKDIHLSTIEGRPTFEHCFNLANELYPDSSIIVSNADIYFNQTLNLLESYDLTNKFLALTRWNVQKNGSLTPFYERGKPNTGSQDTWIFTTPLRKFNNANIQIGTWYCDGRIAYEAKYAEMETINPCLSIQCCHLHLSGIRNYRPTGKPKFVSKTPWCTL